MIKITFPDLSVKEFNKGVTPLEVATSISSSLAKKCIVAKYNDALVDMSAPLVEDGSLELVTGTPEGLEPLLNHSCAHLLAEAIKELYPNAMFGVGPAIEEGFYYDMDLGEVKLTEEDWQQLRKSMDQAYPNLTFRICMLYPKITPHQLRICYLVKLKFTNDNIADLLYSTPASVSIARKRLYEKITSKPGKPEDFNRLMAEL